MIKDLIIGVDGIQDCEIFNAGFNKEIALNDVANLIIKVGENFGHESKIIYAEPR